MAKLIAALVLVDIAAHQLKAGTLLEATPETIKALQQAGEVDPHKDAVAHARAAGLPVVRSAIEAAAEALENQRQGLLLEIAQLEQVHATASDDTKPAVEQQIAAKRKELDALA